MAARLANRVQLTTDGLNAYLNAVEDAFGIDVDYVIAATFFIGSALAGIAGVMDGLAFNSVYTLMGFIAGLKAAEVQIQFGIGSPTVIPL